MALYDETDPEAPNAFWPRDPYGNPYDPEQVDHVWLYREDDTDELRYSVRSMAANLPMRAAYVIGDLPAWWAGGHLPADTRGDARHNTYEQLAKAVLSDEISDPFILQNDDFFLFERMESLPVMHRGLYSYAMSLATTANGYLQTMRQTATYLTLEHNIYQPICYELHVPLTVWKGPMARALDLIMSHERENHQRRPYGMHLNKRSVYGNLAGIGGFAMPDVKVSNASHPDPRGPWLSTNPHTFSGRYRKRLAEAFPEPSRYEA